MIKKIVNQIKNVSMIGVIAVILAGSAAVAKAHISRQTAPNVYNDGGTASAPNWQPLPPGSHRCSGLSNVCTGYQATAGGPVTNITNGVFSN